MEALVTEQEFTAGLIRRAWTNTLKLGQDNLTPDILESRKERLEQYWESFLARHLALLAYPDFSKSEYAKGDLFSRTEEDALLNLASFQSRIKALSSSSPTALRETASERPGALAQLARLPRIDVPTFSGDPLEWESFRDLFRSLVIDVPGLTNAQRLQHLKTSLTGEAADLIRSIRVTDAAFSGAWAELLERYDNKRAILTRTLQDFLSCPPAETESPAEIKRLLAVARRTRRALEALGRPVDHWDDWFVHVLHQQLPPATRLYWETKLEDSRDFPTFADLNDALEQRIRALDAALPRTAPPRAAAPAASSGARRPAATAPSTTSRGKTASMLTTAARPETPRGRACALCGSGHPLNYCSKFKRLNPETRMEEARRAGVCLNCLRHGHFRPDCPSEKRCLQCNDTHHTLLHGARVASTNEPTPREAAPTTVVASHAAQASRAVLLATALIKLVSPRGEERTVRALLDIGAEASFVSERIAQALRLPRTPVNVAVQGIQESRSGHASSEVNLTIRPPGGNRGPSVPLRALVLSTLTSTPSAPMAEVSWPHLAGLELADPTYAKPSRIDAILGSDVLPLVQRNGFRRGPPGTPSALNTIFGWVLYGTASPASKPDGPPAQVMSFCIQRRDLISDALRLFWETEELQPPPILSDDDRACEDHFAATHKRLPGGRFQVRLPLRSKDKNGLGESRTMALRVLLSGERRRGRSPTLQARYVDFMDTYLSLGHMEPCPRPVPAREICYLPHHPVVKATDPEGKIRVVYNA